VLGVGGRCDAAFRCPCVRGGIIVRCVLRWAMPTAFGCILIWWFWYRYRGCAGTVIGAVEVLSADDPRLVDAGSWGSADTSLLVRVLPRREWGSVVLCCGCVLGELSGLVLVTGGTVVCVLTFGTEWCAVCVGVVCRFRVRWCTGVSGCGACFVSLECGCGGWWGLVWGGLWIMGVAAPCDSCWCRVVVLVE